MGTECGRVDLVAHGQGIAAVYEDRSSVGQDDGKASRAAEAREPGQALGAARHILALMLVGARYHEAVEAAAHDFGTQSSQTLRRRRYSVETVAGRNQFCPPGGQRLGQFGVRIRGDQLDPLRSGQALRGGGHAAHQGGQGGGIELTTTLAQELKDVVGG